MRTGIILLCLAALCGCATNYSVEYVTDPAGANMIHLGEQEAIGITPVIVDYGPENPAYMNNGCFQVKGVEAHWASGATTRSAEVITLCGGPGEYFVRLTRPVGTPGMEVDMGVAAQLEQLELARKQQNDQAWFQAYQVFQAAQPKTTTGVITVPGEEPIIYRETTR